MVRQKQVSSLEDHLGYWLRFVSNHVSQAFAAKIARHGIAVAEWVVLRELFEAPQAPSALAERLGMTRGGMSKLVDRLMAKGLVARTPSETDRRFQELELTDSGHALVPVLATIADRNDEDFFGSLAAADQIKLKKFMQSIVRSRGLHITPTE
jgi:DNA-binding MarR family transcriptional regulator